MIPNVSLIDLMTEEEYAKVKKILFGKQKRISVKIQDPATGKEIRKNVKVVYDVNEKDCCKRTVLMYAITSEQNDIAHELLKQGADISAVDEFGVTFVGICAEGNCHELLKFALDKHCETFNKVLVNKPYGSFRSYPIIIAANRGHYETAELLLKAGADPNVRNYDNVLPIERPIASSDDKMVSLLLKYGARADLLTHHGETLLLFSLGNNFPEGQGISTKLLFATVKCEGAKAILEEAYTHAIQCRNYPLIDQIMCELRDLKISKR